MRILDVASEYPCPRACKLSLALGGNDVFSRRPPQAFSDSHTNVRFRPDAAEKHYREYIASHPADVIQFHAEMYAGWLAEAVREGAGDRPLVVNVHDLTCARTGLVPDPYEPVLFDVADAFVFVTEQQAGIARRLGWLSDKPYLVIPNYPSSTMFIDKTPLPHIGGLVYEGGLDKRGAPGAWRDLSSVADAVEMHIYPANTGIDYGIVHQTETDYRVLIHRLAQHDWCFTGTAVPNMAWDHAFPNKVGDGWAAGIPFVALNMPILAEYAERGLGICVDSVEALRKLPDPKPFRKAVTAQRRQFTVERFADQLSDFLEGLC